MTEGAMDKVRLGRTDLMVTSVCFGTSGLGDMPDTYGYGVDEARARATLHAIFDGPANFIDTSRNYGHRPQRGADRRRHSRARRPARRVSSSRPSSIAISRRARSTPRAPAARSSKA